MTVTTERRWISQEEGILCLDGAPVQIRYEPANSDGPFGIYVAGQRKYGEGTLALAMREGARATRLAVASIQ